MSEFLHSLRVAAFGALPAALLAACGGSLTAPVDRYASNPQYAGAMRPLSSSGLGKIKHVVIVIQENRSFNNLFMSYPGATTSTYGYDTKNHKIKLGPAGLDAPYGVEHDAQGFFKSCNGKGSIPGTDCRMNGFDQEFVTSCGTSVPCPLKHPQYAYVPRADVKPYWDMANQYVLADQMYPSVLDAASFTAHQYLIAGQAEKTVNTPLASWGCWGAKGDTIGRLGPNRQLPYGTPIRPCFHDDTIGEEADKAGVSWAFYASTVGGSGGIWSAYQANHTVFYGQDWTNDVISPNTQFFTDVSNGQLRQITWITPTATNSDHPDFRSKTGPMWVASIVNAIGESQYWDNTAIFILWDEYGGMYDPEPPAYADYDGLGIRIPLLVVSAYAKKGFVSHVHYEQGSVLRFVEDLFGLPRLAASDRRATSPEKDCFDFNQSPRKFQKIPSTLGKEYFLRQPPDLRPPDDD